MREKIGAILIGILILGFAGLTVFAIANMPKEVSRREFNTNVTVEDTYYRGSYMTPVKSGKTTTYIHHSAQHKVYVIYGEEQYMINDKDAYNYCKDKEGKIVQAIMAEIKYDDGSVNYKLLEIVTN